MRVALLIFLTPFLALAQLQISLLERGVEKPVPGLLDLGSVQVGEILDTTFRIRNTGKTSITLQTLIVSGTGFRASGYPSLPYIIAPETPGQPMNNVDFTIRFSPSNFGAYSASLSINATSVLLRATSAAGATLSSGGAALVSGGTVDFGAVERGQSSTRKFTLKNPTTSAVAIDAITVSGVGFTGPTGVSAPLQIAGASEISFDVVFRPQASGIAQGALQIDGRSYKLTGSATEPPFPRPSIVLEPGATISAKQGRIAVRFASASRAVGDGKLRIDFEPVRGLDDASIQFVSNSGRTVPFRVTEGATEAVFGGSSTAVFQTGTTAGKIVITAEVGGYKEQLSFTVDPASVQIDSAKAVRNGAMLEIDVVGYDNTRTMGKLSFAFSNSAGHSIQGSPIRVDSSEAAARYFADSKLGGVFSIHATFPVAGNVTEVAGVEVSIENSSGSTSSQRLRF